MPINRKESTKIVNLADLLKDLKGDFRDTAKEDAGEIIVQEIQQHLDRSTSPVSKQGKFKRKKNKQASTLRELGDMRDSIEFETTATGVKVGITDPTETGKAMGHNTGFRGHKNITNGPKRQFIPEPNQDFKRSIIRKVKERIESIRQEQEVSEPITAADLFSEVEDLTLEFDE